MKAEEYFGLLNRIDSGMALYAVGIVAVLFVMTRSKMARTLTGQAVEIPMLWSPALLVSLMVAVAVRVPFLPTSFWYDETFSAAIASLPFDQLHRVIVPDVHPPLSYLTQWLSAQLFGLSEIALRLPSMVFGIASVWLMYHVMIGFGGKRNQARTAALLTALLPMQIWYSVEARGYALLTVLVLVLILSIQRKRPTLFIAGSLITFVHSYGYLYMIVFGLFALFTFRSEFKRWLPAFGVSGGVGSVWLPFMVYQSQDVSNGFWIGELSPATVVSYLHKMTIGLRMEMNQLMLVYALMVIVTVVFAVRYRSWIRSANGLLWLAALGGAPSLAAGVSWLWNPIFLDRALLPSALMLVVAWSFVIHSKPAAMLRNFTAIAFAVSLVMFPENQRFDLRGLFANCSNSDAVYSVSNSVAITARYYTDLPIYMWSNGGDLNQWIPDDAKDALGFRLVHSIDDIDAKSVCIAYSDNPMTELLSHRYLSTHSTQDYTKLDSMVASYFTYAVYRYDRN